VENRDVVVTGAAGGLGPAVVEAFLARGARVHAPLRSASSELAPRDRLRIVEGVDLTDEKAVRDFYASFGAPSPLWASVHVAGGYGGAPIVDIDLAAFRKQIDINLTTAFLCARAAVRAMSATGRGGRIVNVTSRAAIAPSGGAIAYSVSKAGVSMLTQALAVEVKGARILVNAVAPTTIDTPTNRAAMPNADFSTWTKPADIARAIAWFASDDNVNTTGAIVPV